MTRTRAPRSNRSRRSQPTRARCVPDRPVKRGQSRSLGDTRPHRLTCARAGQRRRTRSLPSWLCGFDSRRPLLASLRRAEQGELAASIRRLDDPASSGFPCCRGCPRCGQPSGRETAVRHLGQVEVRVIDTSLVPVQEPGSSRVEAEPGRCGHPAVSSCSSTRLASRASHHLAPAGDRPGRAPALSPAFSARCGSGLAGQPVRPMTA